jgi:hypothetical protein
MKRFLLLLLAAGCSDGLVVQPTSDGGVPGADAGADVQAETGTACEPDAPVPLAEPSAPADAGGPPRPKMHVVNLVAAFPSVRVCFATGLADDGSDAAVAPLPPLPYDDVQPYPRIERSSVYTPPSITDLSKVAVTFYAVDAAKVSADRKGNAQLRRCDTIVAQLTKDTDYKRIGAVAKGALAQGKTFGVVLRDDGVELKELPREGLEPTGMQVWNLSASPADVKIGCTTIATGAAPNALTPPVAFGERGGRVAVGTRAPVPLKDALVNELTRGYAHTVVVTGDKVSVVANDPVLPKFD